MAGPRREKRFDCSMDYASKDIRNILVAGHAGCGKTTLQSKGIAHTFETAPGAHTWPFWDAQLKRVLDQIFP